MSETATSYVVTFDAGADAEARYRVYADPESPAIGQDYQIRAVADFAIFLTSPYAAPTGSWTDPAETVIETVNLSGSMSPASEFPVASLSSVVAVTPIVDASGVVVADEGAAVPAAKRVVNGSIAPTMPLWGSVTVTYTTYPAMVWQFGGQDIAGEYVYFATSAEWSEPVPVTVAVGGTDVTGPVYDIRTVPSGPEVGVPFAVEIRAVETFGLTSPYGQSLTGAVGAADLVTSNVALGGGTGVSPEQPIAALISATVVTPIVGRDGAIIATTGADYTGHLAVADGTLIPDAPVYGSLSLEFRGFEVQSFPVPGLSPAGEYLFLAYSASTPDGVPHTVTISEPSTDYSWAQEDDGTARLVSLYIRPWIPNVTLHDAGGTHAEFLYRGVQSEDVTEEITIIEGVGRASKPVVEVISHVWHYDDLGSVDATEDGTVTAATAGNSIVSLTYQTRKHVWRGTADVEQVLVWVEDEP